MAKKSSKSRGDDKGFQAPEFFKQVLGVISDAVIVANQDEEIVFWSPGAEAVFGYTLNEAMGQRFVDLLVPDEYKYIRAGAFKTANREKVLSKFGTVIKARGLRKDGTQFPMEHTVSMWAEKGDTYFVTILRDDSWKFRAEQKLRRMEALVEASSDAIVVSNKNEEVVLWNPGAEKLFGYTAREMTGKKFGEIIIPPKYQYIRETGFLRAVKNKKLRLAGEVIKAEGLRKDGSRFHLDHTVSMWLEDGDPFIVAILRDTSKQHEAEEKLSQMAKVFMENSDPILIEDLEGNVIDMNEEAERVYGWNRDDLLGKPIKTIVPEENHEQAVTLLERCRQGEKIRNEEGFRINKDKTIIPMLLSLSLLTDDADNPIAVASISKSLLEQKKTELELLRSVKEFEQFIDTANAPIFGINSQGLVNEWNQTAERITGFSKDEVMGRNLVEDFITEEYKAPVREVLDSALAGKDTANFEFPLYTEDGNRVMVLLNATTRRDADGNIVGVMGVGQDITEIDASRQETARIATELTQFVDTANAPIFGVDREGKINEWNQMVSRITGFSKDEVMGRNLVEDFITEEYKTSVKEVLDNALNGKETDNYEVPLYTQGGERVMVLLNATTRRDAQGEIIGVIGVGQDITQLDTQRTQMEAVSKELQQFIDTANAPIFGINSQGLVNEWNQTAERITGFSKDEVMGRNLVEDFITDEYKAPVREVLDSALAGKDTANFEFPLYTEDGNRVMVLLNATTRRDAQGEIIGVIGVGQDITQLDTQRTQMEAVSKELQQFIDTANAPIFGINSQRLVNEWNQTAEQITGFSKDEVMGRNLVEDFITEEYKSPVREVLDSALAGKDTANFEFPLYTEDGNRVMVLLNATTRRDADGNIVGVMGVGQDITEIDASRQETARIATELTQFVDTANAPIFGVDTEGKINEWNQMVSRITGFSKDEVMGRNLVDDFITEEYKKAVKEVLDNALNGKETDNYEVPLYTQGGERVMVLLNATTRRDAQGEIIGVIGVGQDITELSEYQTNLESSVESRTRELNEALLDTEKARDRIDGILKSVADGLIVTDVYNRVILMNRAAEDHLGVRFSEVIDRPIDFAIEDQTLLDRVKATLAKQQTGYQFDFELPGISTDRPRIMRARTSVMLDKTGKPTGIVTIISDVTHEREVDRMKTEFLSTAAHELRTPLTSIQGFSEIILMRDDLGKEERKKFMTYINEQAVALGSIINDLLNISRIESGRGFVLEKDWFNFSDTTDLVLEHARGQDTEHRFEMSLEDRTLQLHGDREKISQVLKNIVSNAVKYSPEGGRIRVTGKRNDNEFQVAISDEGMGMTPEQVGRVFDKFYRADASNSAIEGTGLGMSIVKHIVEAHGGEVRVESEPGVGTTVSFTIPI